MEVTSEDFAESESRAKSNNETENTWYRTLTHHLPDYVAAARADGHTNADLTRSLCSRKADDAVDAEHRENNSDSGKRAD